MTAPGNSAASTGPAGASGRAGRPVVDGRALLASHGSLARGVTAPVPGTVFALALTGGMTLGPGDGREVLFGRNRPGTHVCLGEDDPQVSRHQGTLTHRGGQWWVSNAGRLPIRCADGRLLERVEHMVNGVRAWLSRGGEPWLTREEVGEPVGNALNDNLIRALLMSTTLVPTDLALIDAI
ncbi:hypothetical protein QOM21_35995 [Streptomyces sp. Pv4-95]|uniref:hypothetical protein n=1 Tax=Streptomyces sp. Pv4-95 TaxID=3049543 RepID=UPI0038927D11